MMESINVSAALPHCSVLRMTCLQRNPQRCPTHHYPHRLRSIPHGASDAILDLANTHWPTVAAGAVLGLAAPWLVDDIKTALLPQRCTQCQGATTVLCKECGARGKTGGILPGNPMQQCTTCEGTGRGECSRCRGAGMENSWLWRTTLEVPGPEIPGGD